MLGRLLYNHKPILLVKLEGPHPHLRSQRDRLVPLGGGSLLDDLQNHFAQPSSLKIRMNTHAANVAVPFAVGQHIGKAH